MTGKVTNIQIEGNNPILILSDPEDIRAFDKSHKQSSVIWEFTQFLRSHRKHNVEGLSEKEIETICMVEDQFFNLCSQFDLNTFE